MIKLILLFLLLLSTNVNAQTIIPLKPEDISGLIKQKTQDKAVLINVWATWCGPCIEEFPDIIQIAEKYKSDLEVVFISADFPEDMERVKEFLNNQKVTWPTYIKTGSESEFIEKLHPKWTGALPFTFILKKGGKEITHWENKARMSKFEEFVIKAINPKSEKKQ